MVLAAWRKRHSLKEEVRSGPVGRSDLRDDSRTPVCAGVISRMCTEAGDTGVRDGGDGASLDCCHPAPELRDSGSEGWLASLNVVRQPNHLKHHTLRFSAHIGGTGIFGLVNFVATVQRLLYARRLPAI